MNTYIILAIILLIIIIVIYNKSSYKSSYKSLFLKEDLKEYFNEADSAQLVNLLNSANTKIPNIIRQIMVLNQIANIDGVSQIKEKEVEISALQQQIDTISKQLDVLSEITNKNSKTSTATS
jgi:hypothetical protein